MEERNDNKVELTFPDMKVPGSPVRVNIKEVEQSPKTEIYHKVKEDTAATNGDIIKLHAEFQGFQTSVNLTILKSEESVKSELHLIVREHS